MAQGKDPVTRENGGARSHQIEAEIDRTRAAMDRTVDAIAGKLTPQQLAFEALGVFKDGSSALATKLVQTAREHPVPATIIGIGIGLLLTEKSKGEPGTRSEGRTVGFGAPGSYQGVASEADTGIVGRYDVSSPREGVAAGALHKVEGAAGAVKDKAADMKDSVAAGAMHAKEKVGETAGHVREQADPPEGGGGGEDVAGEGERRPPEGEGRRDGRARARAGGAGPGVRAPAVARRASWASGRRWTSARSRSGWPSSPPASPPASPFPRRARRTS